MLRYLLLVILFFGACTDKQTKSESRTNEVSNRKKIESVIARYGIEPKLFWVDKGYMSSIIESDWWVKCAYTIYHEPISNKYFYATVEKTNNISYDTNSIQNEEAFIEYDACAYTDNGVIIVLKDPLIYIGNTDFFHRVYIDTNGQ
ncbi:MAG: hypothetical protein ACRCVW_02575 [Brevinema sp.]